MRAPLVLATLLAACGGDATVALDFPSGASFAVLRAGKDTRLVLRDETLSLPAPSGEVFALFYAETPEALFLDRDAEGHLGLAAADAEPDSAWSLPPPMSGWVLTDGAFSAASDPRALAAQILVPAPPCPSFAREPAVPLPELQGTEIVGVAARGEVALVATDDSMGLSSRVLRIAGGTVTELTAALRPEDHTRHRVYSDTEDFVVVSMGPELIRTTAVTSTGGVRIVSQAARNGALYLNQSARARGARELYALSAVERSAHRLDLDTGRSRPLASITTAPPAPRCDPFASRQTLVPTSGGVIASVSGAPPHRLSRDGSSATALAPGLGTDAPCSSAYLRFGDGPELLLLLNDTAEGGAYLTDAVWRPSPDAPWTLDRFPASMYGVVAADTYAVGIEATARSDVLLVSTEPRRPEHRPRLCARAGIANVLTLALDVDRGVVIQREHASAVPYLVPFRVVP